MLSALDSTVAIADEVTCGSVFGGGVGPWDYNDPETRVPTSDAPQTRIKLVENVHFKQSTEALAYRDKNLLAGDLAYTLRVFPNHPRALMAISRLELREGGKLPHHPNNVGRTAECYFDRALRFQPDDKNVHHVYGIHLHTRKRFKETLSSYQRAEELGLASAQFYYNFGLLQFDLKNFDEARRYARQAYEGGFALPGLANKLKSVGYWP